MLNEESEVMSDSFLYPEEHIVHHGIPNESCDGTLPKNALKGKHTSMSKCTSKSEIKDNDVFVKGETRSAPHDKKEAMAKQ